MLKCSEGHHSTWPQRLSPRVSTARKPICGPLVWYCSVSLFCVRFLVQLCLCARRTCCVNCAKVWSCRKVCPTGRPSPVLVAECLFGRAPFASKTLSELGQKIKDTKPVEVMFSFDSFGWNVRCVVVLHWNKSLDCAKSLWGEAPCGSAVYGKVDKMSHAPPPSRKNPGQNFLNLSISLVSEFSSLPSTRQLLDFVNFSQFPSYPFPQKDVWTLSHGKTGNVSNRTDTRLMLNLEVQFEIIVSFKPACFPVTVRVWHQRRVPKFTRRSSTEGSRAENGFRGVFRTSLCGLGTLSFASCPSQCCKCFKCVLSTLSKPSSVIRLTKAFSGLVSKKLFKVQPVQLFDHFLLQIELATKAVEKDSAGEHAEAISFYCQALEFFVPAIHCMPWTWAILLTCLKPVQLQKILRKKIMCSWFFTADEKNTRRKSAIREQVNQHCGHEVMEWKWEYQLRIRILLNLNMQLVRFRWRATWNERRSWNPCWNLRHQLRGSSLKALVNNLNFLIRS